MPWIAQCQQLKLSFKLRGSLIPFYLCGYTGFAKGRASSENNIKEVPGVESVEECQRLCDENPDSILFTYYPTKTCELKGDLGDGAYRLV